MRLSRPVLHFRDTWCVEPDPTGEAQKEPKFFIVEDGDFPNDPSADVVTGVELRIRKPGESDFVSPNHGGCWFCCSKYDGGEWLCSREWDANLHKECLLEALRANPDDEEARIMALEFDI